MSGVATISTTSPRIAERAFRTETVTTAPTMIASATPARAGFTPGRSWRRRRQLRGGGRRQDPEDIDRPVAQPGTTDDLPRLDRPEHPRVGGIRAVVGHQEELSYRDDPAVFVTGDGLLLCRIAALGGEEVRLVDLRAVYEDIALADLDGLATKSDD